MARFLTIRSGKGVLDHSAGQGRLGRTKKKAPGFPISMAKSVIPKFDIGVDFTSCQCLTPPPNSSDQNFQS